MEDSVILPVWHGVTKQQVAEFSPSLADKFALDSAREEATDIALKLLREIRPDIYNKQERAQLERLAGGEAMRELQEQIEQARMALEEAQHELGEYKSQFTCPYCGAALISKTKLHLMRNKIIGTQFRRSRADTAILVVKSRRRVLLIQDFHALKTSIFVSPN